VSWEVQRQSTGRKIASRTPLRPILSATLLRPEIRRHCHHDLTELCRMPSRRRSAGSAWPPAYQL
jgi:hypothetical protein